MCVTEMALQNVSMALRGDGDFELRSPLPNIGWRLRKHYYMVDNSSQNYALKNTYILVFK